MQPFVKWAGGKRQLLEEIEKRLPQSFNDYYEPFIGGGACLLEFAPPHATIGDINEALINSYRIIRDDADELMVRLDELTQKYNEAAEKKSFIMQ